MSSLWQTEPLKRASIPFRVPWSYRPLVPAQPCRGRTVEVEWFLPENRCRRNSGASYCRRRPERYQELSAIDIRISLGLNHQLLVRGPARNG